MKTESFETYSYEYYDPYCFDRETQNCPDIIDLTNHNRFKDCSECLKNHSDNEYPSYICQGCSNQIYDGKQYRCFLCHKVFHEACRNNPDPASSTGQWFCLDCINQEKRRPSTFMPHIQNVTTVANNEDSRSDKCDGVVRKSANLNGNGIATFNVPMDISPRVKQPIMDAKDDIVEKVARSLMQKIRDAGRKTVYNKVPDNHFGPIPGIPVGTCWKKRSEVAESGVHRPLVAGISGRHKVGARSIILSGMYPDDEDFGDEFYYSGCGGREHDPYHRSKEQTLHQTLTRLNKALALNCNAPFNDDTGAESTDWRAGKPVRVVRNYKLRKRSKFAPKEGNRYDGIYKVVKYYPKHGANGLLVWRFLLRRDDPEPAPWTEEGERIIEEKFLRMIVPREHENEKRPVPEENVCPPLKKMAFTYSNANHVPKMEYYPPTVTYSRDTSPMTVDIKTEEIDLNPSHSSWYRPPAEIRPPTNKALQSAPNFQMSISSVRSLNPDASCHLPSSTGQYHPAVASDSAANTAIPHIPDSLNDLYRASYPAYDHSEFGSICIKEEVYELPADVEKLIDLDTTNRSIWTYCKTFLSKSKNEFLQAVRLMFLCRSCCKLVNRPVTTPCDHNICLECLEKHFYRDKYSCPDCGYFLCRTFNITENKNLASALESLFVDDVQRR
ncbi:hypothetical protein V9T40_002313 [Parthenolecanium corni]|uniref:RING-type E3 ubiquitin transferase n=1 Tax=Parthenolecanium corni TaxID=536013 RepID=A0AAN9Y598_9HEMI